MVLQRTWWLQRKCPYRWVDVRIITNKLNTNEQTDMFLNQDSLLWLHIGYFFFTKSIPCCAQHSLVVRSEGLWVQYTPFQLGDTSPMITDQHTAGGSVSQLSQMAKLSSRLTLSTKDITTSFWHYNKWFWVLCNQIMGLYNFFNTIE